MRKIIALATAAAMCLSMTACSVSVSTSETTKAAESAAETTAAEAAESSEAADSDLVATADYPTKPINMIILTAQAAPPMCGAESLQPFLRNI